MINKILKILIFILLINPVQAQEDIMILKLKDGDVIIELFKDIAPKHVERFKLLAKEKKYDGVIFHRVIEGFMAQTGDVEFGKTDSEFYNPDSAGTGGSEYPNIKKPPSFV